MFDPYNCILYQLWRDIRKIFWFSITLISLLTIALVIVLKYLK